MVKTDQDSRSWRRLWQFLQPYQVHLMLVVVVICLQIAANMAGSHFLGLILDIGIAGDWATFTYAFWAMLFVWVFSDVMFYVRYRLAQQTGERVAHDIRQQAATRLSRTVLSELEQKHSGDFVSRLSNDIDLIRGLVGREWVQLARGSIAFVAGLIMMLTISWRVTLLTLVCVPFIGIAANALGKPLGRHLTSLQTHMADVNSIAQDAIGGITVSKAFNLKGELGARFQVRNAAVAAAGVQVASHRALLNGVMLALQLLPLFVLFGFGGYEVILGRLTMGRLLVLVSMSNSLTWPLSNMAHSLAQVKAALMASERVFKILDLSTERTGGQTLTVDLEAPYAIELENVHFGYEPTQPVLRGLNLQVAPGERVAIVGSSGSGKSTLFSLLLGFRQPQVGKIRFFGCSLEELDLSTVRQAISYVPQDALLFPTSVAENIAYGNLKATTEEVEQAAQTAYATEFIHALPDGYNTLLGENGVGLSGGQKQRLAMARAIVKDAPILLLDEATSALDTEAEARVQEAIEAISRNRTTLIIAHRLSTIKEVDRIVVLDEGQVAEMGTHTELLRQDGLYARLYKQQITATPSPVAASGN
ncbi:MAG: ABC transporter ATP-binding protein [Firmicutes bacterium]|nr:ABC transporter ATP-binding protein [Bacillota bacterium]